MIVDIKVPSVGESVTEAILDQWYKQDGDLVKKDDPLFVIETDKVTLEVVAEVAGVLKILVPEGETVPIGAVVGTIDTEAVAEAPAEPVAAKEAASVNTPEAAAAVKEKEPAKTPEEKAPEPTPSPEPTPAISAEPSLLSPSVRKLMENYGIGTADVTGTGPAGRITKNDVWLEIEASEKAEIPLPAAATPGLQVVASEEKTTRQVMTPIRQRIAARLLEAKQNTAMLTTFNEIDMSRVIDIRTQVKEGFKAKFGVSLGFMSFFIKASIAALKEFPQINAFIEGKDILLHEYFHIGVAIGGERGLVVPVIRHADQHSMAELEQAIVDFVNRIKESRLELADLEGGTFTISNGGVYGSLLSTPILNIPQSGILGLHKIEKRAVVVDDQIVIRPMMYVALSYDHRIVDGREAVTFLRRIKEEMENPQRLVMEI